MMGQDLFLLMSMVANALELNLAIANTYIVARRIYRRRGGQDMTITHREARAVPETFYDITIQRPFIQWATGMGTRCRDAIKELLEYRSMCTALTMKRLNVALL